MATHIQTLTIVFIITCVCAFCVLRAPACGIDIIVRGELIAESKFLQARNKIIESKALGPFVTWITRYSSYSRIGIVFDSSCVPVLLTVTHILDCGVDIIVGDYALGNGL